MQEITFQAWRRAPPHLAADAVAEEQQLLLAREPWQARVYHGRSAAADVHTESRPRAPEDQRMVTEPTPAPEASGEVTPMSNAAKRPEMAFEVRMSAGRSIGARD